jgi:hypothetical protein
VTRKNKSKHATRQRQHITGEPYLKALAAIRGDQPDDGDGTTISAGELDPVLMPWRCGDEPPQCPVGWHLQQWVTVPEILVDRYFDGDWDPADPDDVPPHGKLGS